jgi:hypothetical protein
MPTRRVLPSLSTRPSRSIGASATSTPRLTPVSCEAGSRDLRCTRPNSIANQYQALVMSPRPSPRAPIPPVISPRIRPLPSRSARPSALPSIKPEDMPAYIPARVNFPQADPVEFTRPVVMQQMQASIACSFRLPLEQIQIQNISYTDLTTGARTRIAADPTQFMMSSGGTVQCLEFNTTIRTRRLQQSSGNSQIECEFLIMDPPVEVLVLNDTEFSNTITASDSIQSLAQSIGSTGVSSEVAIGQYAAPVASNGQTQNTIAGFQIPQFSWYIVGAGGFVIVIVATIVTKLLRKRHANKKVLNWSAHTTQIKDQKHTSMSAIIPTNQPQSIQYVQTPGIVVVINGANGVQTQLPIGRAQQSIV